MEDGQLASTEDFLQFSICYVELALESSDKIQNFFGLNFWPRMQGKVPTIFRHVPILELSGGHVELGDNTCLVHFFQSRELRSVRQKTVHQF